MVVLDRWCSLGGIDTREAVVKQVSVDYQVDGYNRSVYELIRGQKPRGLTPRQFTP